VARHLERLSANSGDKIRLGGAKLFTVGLIKVLPIAAIPLGAFTV
jgi:hypothetical protein